jgi:hypothetical protein
VRAGDPLRDLLRRRDDWVFLVVHLVLSRLLYLGVGITTPLLLDAAPTTYLHQLAEPAGQALRDLLIHGDSVWYHGIVQDGYTVMPFDASEQRNWAFFPLYPFLTILAGGSHLSGILVANLALVAASRLLMAEVRSGWGGIAARWVVLFLLYQPFSGMFSSYRPESILLLAAVGAWVAARRGQWWVAWLCVAAATMTRSQGILVTVLLLDPLIAQRSLWRARALPIVVGAAFPLLALGAFSGYLASITGEPLAWARILQAWGRTSPDPLRLLQTFWPRMWTRYAWDFVPLNALILAVLLLAAARLAALRQIGAALFATGAGLGAALLGSTLISIGRYATAAFPVPVLLATDRRLRRLRLPILVASTALLAGVAAWTGLGIRGVLP